MDKLTKEQRHKNMSHIHSKDTKPEIMLRKALWHRGVRYRKNYKDLPGKPDIAITRCRIAVFVDGDFWHGRNMGEIELRIDTNKDFWIQKLLSNKKRDQAVDDRLTEYGWLVLRFWESDINNDLIHCVDKIMKYIPT